MRTERRGPRRFPSSSSCRCGQGEGGWSCVPSVTSRGDARAAVSAPWTEPWKFSLPQTGSVRGSSRLLEVYTGGQPLHVQPHCSLTHEEVITTVVIVITIITIFITIIITITTIITIIIILINTIVVISITGGKSDLTI
ncbi:unnamed protein product [Pleuronectes platessa]|uniref:Uncharacterized protein n=1 Tax=Pleuronectes platessa TaxID=8262 RepID=A0A9N7VUZ0_PLEPL|nr:unnamed protein product [Pleuronectes platessa]